MPVVLLHSHMVIYINILIWPDDGLNVRLTMPRYGSLESQRNFVHVGTSKPTKRKRNTSQRKSRRGRKTYARTFLRHIDPSAGSFFQQFRREIDVFSLSLCYIGLFVHVRMPTDTKCKPPYISQTEMCAVLS